MKKFIFILFIINYTFLIGFAQSGWFWQNPLPTGNYLENIKFFDVNTGLCLNTDNILRTTNSGINWQLIYTSMTADNQSMYLVDANTGFVILSDGKLMKTVNGGLNWIYVSTIPITLGHSLYFTDENTGYISEQYINYNGGIRLLRTSNGGMSWTQVFADSTFQISSISFVNPLKGFMAGNINNQDYHVKFLKTLNGGLSWDTVQNDLSLQSAFESFLDDNTGYITGTAHNGSGIIYKTTNSGGSWFKVYTLAHYGIGKLQFIDNINGFAPCGNNRLSKTSDGGVTWITYDLSNFTSPGNINEYYFVTQNTGFACGEGGLLAKTINGGTNWIMLSNGQQPILWDVTFSDNNTGIVAGDGGKIFRTTNGGNNWILTQLDHWYSLGPVTMVNPNKFFVVEAFSGKLFRTKNAGISWDTLNTGHYAVNRLKFVNELTGYGVCKYNDFIKTTDGGITWTFYNAFTSGQNWAMDFVDENTGYAGGDYTYKTTNGGMNWNILNLGVSCSDIQFINQNTGFIGGAGNGNYGVVLRTTNAGLSWNTYSFPNTGNIVDINFLNERIGFALSYNSVFKTTDGGVSFSQYRTCTENFLTTLCFTDSITGYGVGQNGAIIKTTNGGGQIIGVSPISTTIPQKFSLSQNYPNPFNPTTNIGFRIANFGFIKITVFDILGREVAVLVNEQLKPGVYSVDWNAEGFASGIYFYSLTAGEFTQTKKMVLLK